MEKIGFGGGCHWCTEAMFASVTGVIRVEMGFIQSIAPDDAYSEAVVVYFDPAIVTLTTLTDIHLNSHASTSQHSMRAKYRSAIYAFSDEQVNDARCVLTALQDNFDAQLITQVLPFVDFKPALERYHNYHQQNADSPFSQRFIEPKLNKLITKFPSAYSQNER